MDAWILRPGFEKALGSLRLPAKIFRATPEGQETELEDMMLERERDPEIWEQVGLLAQLVRSQVDKRRQYLILDLSTLEKVDSSGIGEIVAAFQPTADSDTEMVLANPRPKIREILHRTELDKMIPIYDSIEEAVRHFDA